MSFTQTLKTKISDLYRDINEFKTGYQPRWSQSSVVGIAPRPRAGQSGVQILGGGRDFSLIQIVQTDSGAHSPSYSNHQSDFDVKYQLLVRCSAFLKYLRANWNTSPRFGHEGDFIFSVSWTP
jgi:hypothetical protein